MKMDDCRTGYVIYGQTVDWRLITLTWFISRPGQIDADIVD